MEFKRKVYVKPPEPVYGDRVDASDPAAPKDFAEHAIESLVLDVYEPTRQYGDMAPEEPREGQYHYEIRRNAKDGAEIEYVEITKEEMT